MDIQVFLQGLNNVFAAGQADKVVDYLQRSLSEAEAEDDRHAVVTILNEMIGYFRNTSRYQDAIRTAERAMMEMRCLGYEHSIPFGTTLLNAATALRASGDNRRALELYQEAQDIYETQLLEPDRRLAGLYNNISSLHEAEGNYEKACELLQKALQILSHVEDARIVIATVHTNLALVLFALKRETEAMASLRAALDIFEQEDAGKRRVPHYAAALAGLAGAYYKMEQYAEAVQVYERALSHLKDCFGENRDFAITRRNCALALDAVGQPEQADEYRKSADAILARIG